MANTINIWSKSLIAAADLSASQYCAVIVDTAGKAALPGSTGLMCIGILQDKPTSGQVGQVLVHGESKALCNGTVTAGDHVAAITTTGKIATAATGNYILGIAMESGTAGALITVDLLPGGISA